MAAAQRIGDVAFEPCNENHAITEVVFAVVGLQGFTPDDRSSVKAAHSKWQEPVSGRTLRRMHINSTVDDDCPQVRFDTSHTFDGQDTPDLRSMFVEPDTLVDDFIQLSATIQQGATREPPAVEMAKRINLHAD